MRVFLDERPLHHPAIADLLLAWRRVAEYTRENADGPVVLFDGHAVRADSFLRRFNALSADRRLFFRSMIFGATLLTDWRPHAISESSICELETEIGVLLQDCAVCEAYEHRKAADTVAIFGHDASSYATREVVGVSKLDPPDHMLTVRCGTSVADLQRLFANWGCLAARYDATMTRPPRDGETILGKTPDRFVRTGRFERTGRRQVYCELSTGRYFYVDNLHVGSAAHLEVFDANECHVGTATLEGQVDVAECRAGRTIRW